MSTSKTPGVLRSRASLRINTRKAHALIQGRRQERDKPAIVGLVRFSALTGPIYSAATNDDPWADWWLVKIEREITNAKEGLAALQAQVEAILNGREALDVEVAYCEEPVRVELRFRNPYGFLGSYLIADYDQLVLAILTARHTSLLSRAESEKLLESGGHLVRRVFHAVHGYRFMGVSREDVRQGTAKAAAAAKALGELPQEVLEGKLRAEHAPTIGIGDTDTALRAAPEPPDEDDWSNWGEGGDSEGAAAAS